MDAVKNTKLKKILNIGVTVLLYVFLFVSMLALVLSLVSQKGADGATTLFGYQMRVIVSDSMGACDQTDVSQYEIGSLPIRSMVFVETVPEDETEADQWYAQLKKGDVLTFRYTYTTQVTITHRIIDIYAKETGGYMITLEGDNKNADMQLMQQVIDTSSDSYNYVIGKVTGSSMVLGFLTSLLKEPLALVLIIIVPCAIIIVLEIVKIVSMFGSDEDKKKRREQEDEIEALKRQLAALQGNQQPDPGAEASEGAAAPPEATKDAPAKEQGGVDAAVTNTEEIEEKTSEEAVLVEREERPIAAETETAPEGEAAPQEEKNEEDPQ